jgi:beta-ureidopropionase / N-carbamoyl-L-amino-acid hydrolase
MKQLLQIDGPRLWVSLTEMARIGATAGGGVRRLALTEEDRQGRELFARWCCEAGMTVWTDEVGNLFARRAGTDANAAPVLMGAQRRQRDHGKAHRNLLVDQRGRRALHARDARFRGVRGRDEARRRPRA